MSTLAEATAFFARLFRGEHHIPSEIRAGGGQFSVRHYVGGAGLSTFDHDELTRLVFLAHELGWRAVIHTSTPKHVRVCIYKRPRPEDCDFDIARCHPTLDDAVDKFRSHDGTPWPRLLSEGRIAAEKERGW